MTSHPEPGGEEPPAPLAEIVEQWAHFADAMVDVRAFLAAVADGRQDPLGGRDSKSFRLDLQYALESLRSIHNISGRLLLPLLDPLIAAAGHQVPEWRSLVDFRNRLVHDWHNVTPEEVWEWAERFAPTLEWMAEAVEIHPVAIEDPPSILEVELAAEVECVVLADLTGQLGVAILGGGPDSRRIRELRWAQRS